MRVKICGIRDAEQGKAIAELGATAIGFICVPRSKRYLTPAQILALTEQLPHHIDRIAVFANATISEICQVFPHRGLSGMQLHGDESPEFCQQLRQALTQRGCDQVELIKALRIRTADDLQRAAAYEPYVDTFLLDAYHPQQLGGTGIPLDWQALQKFTPQRPWFLAGGLTPENIQTALGQLQPDGIDVSSGVEIAPADKDISRVAALLAQVKASDRASRGT
ncbi:phosphoribosylanthranilate isomerase [Geitlerinema sp. PCC 9228]|jgi:phosphoribosylanthranilate isomerase|uniref:phosphoribosylanthranilate isomerase n=1 Tax=Geitlerinema sp. PCC 9228 TaxID=111611 RepID=UPI0008F9DCD8|nr:phosphoribosylanthranilate isomerase [Geitlerinema sp. PCC 9228]